MLRKILAAKIALEPVGAGRQRGYNFRGTLSLERLIEGEAMSNTSDGGGPNGIRSSDVFPAVPFERLAIVP